MPDDQPLLDALAAMRERGAVGETSIPSAVAHAQRFVDALPAATRRLADLGSGGGLPALVIGWRRRDVEVTMIERRATRADLLRRAVSALGLANCDVRGEDVRATTAAVPRSFDVVTARSFAAPAITATWAARLLAAGGLLLVSEPPGDEADRWPASLLERVGLLDLGAENGLRHLRRAPGDD